MLEEALFIIGVICYWKYFKQRCLKHLIPELSSALNFCHRGAGVTEKNLTQGGEAQADPPSVAKPAGVVLPGQYDT